MLYSRNVSWFLLWHMEKLISYTKRKWFSQHNNPLVLKLLVFVAFFFLEPLQWCVFLYLIYKQKPEADSLGMIQFVKGKMLMRNQSSFLEHWFGMTILQFSILLNRSQDRSLHGVKYFNGDTNGKHILYLKCSNMWICEKQLLPTENIIYWEKDLKYNFKLSSKSVGIAKYFVHCCSL